MSDKKQNIMEVAVKFFAEKGYHATSIQDIADALGIAKGAMYFYFKSKEDLLVQICRHYLSIFIEEFVSIMEDSNRDPRARLAKQIILKSERFSDNRNFITMFIKERFEVNEEIHSMFHELKRELLAATKHCIVELYGDKVKPYAEDVAIMFSSITDGYLGMMHMGELDYKLHDLSGFLVDRLDDIVKGLMEAKPKPIVSRMDG